MGLGENEKSKENKQINSTENRKTVHEVDLSSHQEVMIEYTGGQYLVTAERMLYYKNNEKKVKGLEEDLRKQTSLKNKYKSDRDIIRNYYKNMEIELNSTKGKMNEAIVKINEKEIENHKLKEYINRLEMQVAKYDKFVENQRRGKKSFLKERHKNFIYQKMIQGMTIKAIHQEFVKAARSEKDERLINVSYETIRATVSELKEQRRAK